MLKWFFTSQSETTRRARGAVVMAAVLTVLLSLFTWAALDIMAADADAGAAMIGADAGPGPRPDADSPGPADADRPGPGPADADAGTAGTVSK